MLSATVSFIGNNVVGFWILLKIDFHRRMFGEICQNVKEAMLQNTDKCYSRHFHLLHLLPRTRTQQAVTCSKPAMEIPEQCVKFVQS